MTRPGWIAIGRADDVPRWEGRRVTVDGARIAVFRGADGLFAVGADCPHAGGPLQDGLVADGCVTCPLHGRRFDLRTGARLGLEGADAAEAGLTVYAVAEADGALWLRLPPAAAAASAAAAPAGAPTATRG